MRQSDTGLRRTMIPTVKFEIPGKRFIKSESRTSVTLNLLFLTLAANSGSGWDLANTLLKKM